MMELFKTEQERIEDFKKYAGDIFNDEQIEKLKIMGYFIKPASIKHHGKSEGDLYLHSKVVAMLLVEYTSRLELTWQDERAARRIGLLHDLCKTDDYTLNFTGIKQEYDGFKYNDNKIMPGHGEKSAIFALQLVPDLTDEEIMCIRYHMGAWVGKEEFEYVSHAIRNFGNVTWTMQADLTASQILCI